MEFKFRSFKKSEFESTFMNMCHLHKMGAGNLATFNDDGDYVTAIIPDEVILELDDEEVDELGSIH